MINPSDEENRLKLIKIELNSLKSTLAIQKNLNKQLLMFMKNFFGNIEVNFDYASSNKYLEYINKSTSMLNKSNRNISQIQNLINKLQNINICILEKPNINIEKKIDIYNNNFNKSINTVYKNTTDIQSFIYEISLIDLSDFFSELNKSTTPLSMEKSESNITISAEEVNDSFIENTLIISETRGEVILPYNINNIKEILLHNNETYSSLSDVIKKVYTIPLKRYKFSSIARFKEAYTLMIEKEHSSKAKALSLASELFANYNLHPAIITACKSLDELDIYLACLEDNTLRDFNCFDIKYEMPPAVISNTSNTIGSIN